MGQVVGLAVVIGICGAGFNISADGFKRSYLPTSKKDIWGGFGYGVLSDSWWLPVVWSTPRNVNKTMMK
jgi:hypothetical protein